MHIIHNNNVAEKKVTKAILPIHLPICAALIVQYIFPSGYDLCAMLLEAYSHFLWIYNLTVTTKVETLPAFTSRPNNFDFWQRLDTDTASNDVVDEDYVVVIAHSNADDLERRFWHSATYKYTELDKCCASIALSVWLPGWLVICLLAADSCRSTYAA